MRRLACFGFALALVPMSFCQAKTGAQKSPTAFTIAVDQPVYADEPIWVHALNGPTENVRYPFQPTIGYFGCNKLEVWHEGTLVTPSATATIPPALDGIACGSAAPHGSPEARLPLHIVYPLIQPGTYLVRWTIESPNFAPGPLLLSIGQSQWLTFTVLAATPAMHESWLQKLIASPPDDPGQLAGDFLPALAADAPDPRALKIFLKYLYSDNEIVAREAESALELFPQSEVMRVVASAIEEHGPSDQLAYYATYHTGWTVEDEDKIVHAAVTYLQLPEPRPVSETIEPWAPTRTSAAIKLLLFIFYVPNHAWPPDPRLNSWADAQILRAAPGIMADASEAAVQQLAEYLGSMQPSADAHELLLRITDREDDAGRQARICLGWHRSS